ncbi:glycerol-3-phosphate 1-O-acyltransferase PlsB [Propionivibrio sp.]|uniref:glycerol-3-phosphate 1-O-acyltransferase PlsB n=1 Tax=Propionivibrio sp. TaxID=2212460 RepID=UPI0025F50C2A|nr:glycerol-3-phosphate 1-O-acyltransferase PlsB [Propionivibrio sp.]MBK7355416.1 glycerol-3-phosphate 1-O-acyltransferase PlsB [Propionivibrio sp.]
MTWAAARPKLAMANYFSTPGWVIHLARRLLYFWVRTTVFPQHPDELGLDPAKPVCYVLQHPHVSNLLIVYRESRSVGLPSAEAPFALGRDVFPRSAFFLNPKPIPGTGAGEPYAPAPLMTAMVRETLADARLDVQIVPVVILWGRHPGKQESILKALFAEAWQQPGPLRRLLTILLHGRNVLVRFNTPLSLHAFCRDIAGEQQALQKLSRVLREHFRRQRQMAIGPDLSHRHTQVGALLDAPRVRSAIATEAETQHISPAEARLRARRFILEIASDYSYGVTRAFELALSWLWTQLFDGIEIHHAESITQIAPGLGIIYIPTHRSHMDYLLLSYIVHHQGLASPHIAAGDNLNFFLVGPLLRRAGAFFMRRSFKGEPLYATVFDEYLHLMLTRGFPIGYFIEGGRSRNGSMLSPKAGILGMTIRSYIREHDRPLVLVPVYIGYEKLIEGRTYLREMAGKPKQRESLWALLNNLRRIRRVFGKVHLNFGQPLALADFLETCRPGWSSEASADIDPWAREATHRAAAELARRMNEAAVINPVNLIALSLLPLPGPTVEEHVLERLLEDYQALAVDAPYSPLTIPCAMNSAQIVAYVERLGMITRIAHPQGNLIQLSTREAPLLAYFRNNALHLFALPSLIAGLLNRHRPLDTPQVIEVVAGIYDLIAKELFLRWTPEEIPQATLAVIDVLVKRGLLLRDASERLCAPEDDPRKRFELHLIGETLRPLLEDYFIVLTLLERSGSGHLTRHALENDCQQLARRLAVLQAGHAPDYSGKAMFSSRVTQLIDADYLHEEAAGYLHFDQRLTTMLAHAKLFLPAEARELISRLACADPLP